MSVEIESVELETGHDPAWSVIWLHGLGADGHDFEPIAEELGFESDPAIRFIFPHAPIRSITINGGMEMRGWYDIKQIEIDREEDRPGLEDSAAIVNRLIAQENARGIPSDHIFLAGFSQGGAIALFAGLRYSEPLAGIIALSTYLADSATTQAERSQENSHVPIFMAHGDIDPVIPVSHAETSKMLLEQMGYSVQWWRYPMPHSVCAEEVAHLEKFMRTVFSQN